MRPLARTVLSTLLAAFVVGLAAPPALADAPVGVDDQYSTAEDQPLTVAADVGVLANDTDTESASLTAQGPTDPTNGSLALQSDGSFTYTPAGDFQGSDSFTYQPFDGPDGGNTTTVTITVTPVNDPPVATDDSPPSTAEDTPLIVDVLANDTDIEGDALSVESVGDPVHGTAVGNVDGTVTYTPAADFHGSDSFAYTAADGNGGTDTATVTVSVTSVNDAPDAADDAYGTTHDLQLTVSAPGVLTNDTDTDLDGLTAVAGDGPAHGTLTLYANGRFDYMPDVGFVGDDSFTYTASDGAMQSAAATVTISVTDQPPASVDDSYPAVAGGLLEDTVLQVGTPGVLGNDSDPEGDPVAPAVDTGPAHGDVTLAADGSFEYTPDPNFAGQDSFTYRSTDTVGGLGAPATVTIEVTGTEDDPVAIDDTATTAEDTQVTIPVLANDSDPDTGDVLTIDLPAGTASGGSVTDNGDGTVSFLPTPDFNGDAHFDYTANDGHGGEATGHVTVHVTPVNDAPVGVTDSYPVTSKPFTPGTGVLGNDSDVDDDTLHAVLVSGPTLGTLTGGLHGDGTFTYTPNANVCVRNDSFTYRVTDGTVQSAPITAALNVNLGKTPATMTVARSATTIDYQGSVTVTAHLAPFSKGAKITISRAPFGDAPIPLVTHAPDVHGNLQFVIPSLLKRNAFTATSTFDNCHTPATSAQAVVLVRAKITAALAGGHIVKGVRTYPGVNPFFSTRVVPPHPGSTVRWVWQVKQGGTWKDYFTPIVTLGQDSSVGFGLAGWTPNALNRIRAIGPFDGNGHALADNAPATSAWSTFRVVPAAGIRR